MVLQRLIAGTLIALAVSIVILIVRATPGALIPIRRLDESLYDSLYQSRVIEDRQNSEVVIVAVDQASLEAIDQASGYQRGWPWPRKYWGSLLEYLSEDCHAKAVVFDMLFTERSVNPGDDGKSDDEQFATAIERARKDGTAPPVFGANANANGTLSRFIPPVMPPPAFGAVNISDSEKWRVYLPTRNGQPSLAAQGLRAAKMPSKLPEDQSFLMHYYGPYKSSSGRQTFRYVSAANVIFVSYGEDDAKWHINKEMFRDKIVLVGGIATGTYDEKATPLSSKSPGIEIQATAIENMIHGDQVRRLGPVTTAGVTILVAWLASIGVIFPSRVWMKLAAALFVGIALVSIATMLFKRHNIIWLPLASPLLAAIITTIGAFAWSFFGEDRQRRQLLKALSSVVSPTIAEELARDPSKLAVGGQRREMTVMFTDIAGFTDISETLPPEKLAPMLNFYLEEMSGIVLAQTGTLDKYIGDAIMSFWNAPLPQPDHAALACRAALRIVEREAAIQPQLAALGASKIMTRLGINSGPMAVGFTGSSHLINYTVLGDSVNLGSRLEGANKLYGTRVMLSQSTAALVKDRFVLRQLDVLRVKGKLEPMAVYELISEGTANESVTQRVRLYEEGLRQYQSQQWPAAESTFGELLKAFPDDAPSKAMLARIAYYREHPPATDWDGVFVAKDK
jgi:adenylate cyclase